MIALWRALVRYLRLRIGWAMIDYGDCILPKGERLADAMIEEFRLLPRRSP